jgi:hypothetical protein
MQAHSRQVPLPLKSGPIRTDSGGFPDPFRTRHAPSSPARAVDLVEATAPVATQKRRTVLDQSWPGLATVVSAAQRERDRTRRLRRSFGSRDDTRGEGEPDAHHSEAGPVSRATEARFAVPGLLGLGRVSVRAVFGARQGRPPTSSRRCRSAGSDALATPSRPPGPHVHRAPGGPGDPPAAPSGERGYSVSGEGLWAERAWLWAAM